MAVVLAALSYLAFWALLPFLLTHPKLRRGIGERLGSYPEGWPNLAPGPRVWVHGASAGDVLALIPTVRALRARRPDIRVVLTTITNSGLSMAKREGKVWDAVAYLPYDLPGAVRRALDAIGPKVLVLEYTELWPQLIRAASARGVSLVLHNGRLSDGRLRSYRRLFRLTGNLLHAFRLLLMRDEREGDNARRLGAADATIHITGNTKFDNLLSQPDEAKVAELARAASFQKDAPVWLLGSTHEGEEAMLLEVFRRVRERLPSLRLIIAPRYVERSERLAALAARAGFATRRRSQPGGECDVLILDTIGELAACYALATVVLVGGSFVNRGGQNILEPAACGKPTLFGPDMRNFADSVQVLLGRGGIQVASAEQLERVLLDLLQRHEYRADLGAMAREQVRSVRGAAGRNAELIAQLL